MKLREHWEIMRDEALNIKNFFPNVSRPKGPLDSHSYEKVLKMLQCKGWSMIEDTDNKWWNFPLVINGQSSDVAKELTPRTIKILENFEILFCGFSLLLPRGIITPHQDSGLTVQKTYHLGLQCPKHSYLIHNGILYEEENGKLLRFDATIEHSAVNMSDEPRIILYLLFKK